MTKPFSKPTNPLNWRVEEKCPMVITMSPEAITFKELNFISTRHPLPGIAVTSKDWDNLFDEVSNDIALYFNFNTILEQFPAAV